MRRAAALAAAGLFAALLAALLASACARKPKEEQGREISRNPAAAVTQVGEAMKKATEAAQQAAEQKPVPPVKFEALLPFLPPAPAGWTAEEPFGETTQAMGFDVSTVRRRYRGPGSLEVTITDSSFHPMITAGVTMAAQFAKETTEGYERGVTLDGNPGVTHWRKDGSHAELTVLAGKRYLVDIRATQVPEGFTRKVWESMNPSGLAALK